MHIRLLIPRTTSKLTSPVVVRLATSRRRLARPGQYPLRLDIVIGTGRIIGDDGAFLEFVDMAMLAMQKGNGVGKIMVKELEEWRRRRMCWMESGAVLLFAERLRLPSSTERQ